MESSKFGSEIVALKNAIELVEALRYKLQMFGIPIDGPTSVFCDNEAVTKNCSIPESTLRKSIIPLPIIGTGRLWLWGL